MPEADVLTHCGDYSRDHGSWIDTVRFADWMSKQPHKYKILCPGNHDQAVAQNPTKADGLFREHGIHMLGKKPVVIDDVRFDGGPYMPISGWDPPWGFELEEERRKLEWERIESCDVLVTHTPPQGILDRTNDGQNIGCPVLGRRISGQTRPRLHCFGHVHEARGTVIIDDTVFMNASSNTRGTYVRDDVAGTTFMTMSVRDAIVYDLET